MNKQEIYSFLEAKGIDFEVTEHKAVFSMEELSEVELPYPEADAKNLFVRDDKRRSFYLITVKGDKRVNLKEFRKQNGTRPLSFASAEELSELLQLTPGSVSPFGLFNDNECRVEFFIDSDFFDEKGIIGVHPNDNTATVWLRADDLTELIREHGNVIHKTEL